MWVVVKLGISFAQSNPWGQAKAGWGGVESSTGLKLGL